MGCRLSCIRCYGKAVVWQSPYQHSLDPTFIPTQQTTSHACRLCDSIFTKNPFPPKSAPKMRLLEHNNGEFSLTEDFGDEIPLMQYFRTHGEREEVTFRDLIDGTGKDKAGYRKIQFCGEQARRDGLQYFWVDTCCIDKSNSTELQRLSTLCFAGTAMRLNATSICQMFRDLLSILTTSLTSRLGNRHFGKADGSLEAGPFKSLLRRLQLNSSQKRGSYSVIRYP